MSEKPRAVVPFSGDLLELKELLEAEARVRPGQWATRLVRDTSVGIRLNRAKRRWELLIWQDGIPATLGLQSRWEGRVRELQRGIRCLSWTRRDDVVQGDTIAAVFEAPIHDPADLKR